MKDHPKLESLFLNDNSIDTDGAYPLSKLLHSDSGANSTQLKELHIAYNKIAPAGLCVIMDVLSKHNKVLKFLDISFNVIDIGILRSLRHMIEKNSTLNYLSLNGLHKFNQRAI